MRVAVVGATGAVGSTMLGVMRERASPPTRSSRSPPSARPGARSTTATATSRSRRSRDEAIQGFDLALFSAGSAISAEWAPRFADAGAVVVDNSSHWRMHDDVPLVVSEVNPEALEDHRGIVANPNCTTMQTVVALGPILEQAGIERVVMSSYQAVSGTGQRAVEELHARPRRVIEAKELPAPSVYPHQIAFNVLPQVETFKDGDDYTTEERKCMRETRKILGRDDVGVSATCARVPVYTGHSVSANVQTREPLSPDECRELLAPAPRASTVVDDPANGLYPTALDAAGRDDVLVGRIRRDPSHERCLNLWIVGNNLRKGAATNAVQVAELLNVRGPAARARPRRLASLTGPPLVVDHDRLLAREARQLAARGDAELAVDVARVGAHGLDADREPLRDLRRSSRRPGAARAPRPRAG